MTDFRNKKNHRRSLLPKNTFIVTSRNIIPGLVLGLLLLFPQNGDSAIDPNLNLIYKTITLEDFEGPSLDKLNFTIKDFPDHKLSIKLYRNEPAPIPQSKQYISLEFRGGWRNSIVLSPKQPIELDDYVHSISIWAYGLENRSKLEATLTDVYGNLYKFQVAILDHQGWKKVELPLGSKINQMNTTYHGSTKLSLSRIEIQPPGRTGNRPLYNIQLDDITATVRQKYQGRPLEKFKLK